jgi:hypothetical protein
MVEVPAAQAAVRPGGCMPQKRDCMQQVSEESRTGVPSMLS